MTEASAISGGRYRLVEILGTGGMATVYRAEDARLDCIRAVKVLSPALARNASLRSRFEAEARTMAKLDHPNIVAVHDVGDDGDNVFIVMELVEGGSLSGWLEQHGPMPPKVATAVMRDVLAAVSAAHEAGIVHRDLKPQNVLLTRRGVPKVSDFGIARIATDATPRLTRVGAAMGTYGFMSPEQRSDASGVDGRADIYACGATLFVLLTAREPGDLFMAERDPGLLSGVEPALATVIERATRYDASDRYANPEEMAEALVAAMPGLPEVAADAPPLAVGGKTSSSGLSRPDTSGSHATLAPKAADTLVLEPERKTLVPKAPIVAGVAVGMLGLGVALVAVVGAGLYFLRPTPEVPVVAPVPVVVAPPAPAVEVVTPPIEATPVPEPTALPANAPSPASPAPEVAPAPAAVEPEPLVETTPTPVVVAEVTPESAPEPVAAPPCISPGTYEGRANGRPFTLVIQSVDGTNVRAQGRTQLGQTLRTLNFTGTCEGGVLSLSEPGGMQLRGSGGEWSLRGK